MAGELHWTMNLLSSEPGKLPPNAWLELEHFWGSSGYLDLQAMLLPVVSHMPTSSHWTLPQQGVGEMPEKGHCASFSWWKGSLV